VYFKGNMTLNLLMSLSEKGLCLLQMSLRNTRGGGGGGRKRIINRSGELGLVCLDVLDVKNGH
jgi:hypothetical protein